MTDHKEWLERITGGASVNAVAGKIGLNQTTLNDQVSGKSALKPATVVDIARTYGVSPVASLVELGLITEAEARDAVGLGPMRLAFALRDATDDQLLREIAKRLRERKASGGRATVQRVAKRSAEQAGASEFGEE